ncbi:Crp/Fnr family transcriptional regulator [Alkalihalobacillus macyae]|uniref:Crp/Fnr family transcriptional regulator n=1 Tax=Guptibacillus hwajinpoensis TaxID=208199 RepID=UPI00273CD792|nr:Crp/Fnr family transcriptional regulator [Alkalihalobacillus macyae]MDP4552901.1 Crp/Fnr family transcriptional regulator [Alkalihalobacillus macyae]
MKHILNRTSLFHGLDDEEIEEIEKITRRKQYSNRTFVFMEGDEREAVFFIQSGVVKTHKIDEDGNEQVISLLKSGDMFPHVGFFDHSPYPANARVMQDAVLLIIRIDDFNQLLFEKPHLAIKVMQMMGKKILQLQERVQSLISQDVRHRLIHAINKLAYEHGKKRDGGIAIDFPITNQDLANIVGTSRESINRLLNQLKKDEIVKSDRNGIFIYSLDKLRRSE